MGEEKAQGLEGGRLYIEGQPVEWNGSLPEIEEAEPLPTVPGSMEQTLTLTLEQAEALERLAQNAREVCERICEALWELAKWASEVISRAASAIAQAGNDLVEHMLYAANNNPKWWHLYKHAKKYRTRKKYRRRLMQQLLSKLRAANAQEVEV